MGLSATRDEIHVWRARPDSLREVLSRYLDLDPALIELREEEHGKPALAFNPDDLRFNLSHSGSTALIAVTRGREVGVDIERIRPRRDLRRLARRALDAEAAAAVAEAEPAARVQIFHEAWTRREALAKCAGVGLHAPLPDTAIAVWRLDPGEGWAASVAVAGRAELPVRWYSSERPDRRRPR